MSHLVCRWAEKTEEGRVEVEILRESVLELLDTDVNDLLHGADGTSEHIASAHDAAAVCWLATTMHLACPTVFTSYIGG